MIYELIAIIAPVFVCAALGYGWARLERPYDTEFVTTLVTNIGAPCLVFYTLSSVEINAETFGAMAGVSALAVAASAAAGIVVLRAARLSMRTFLPSLMFPNVGNMGMPLCLFAFGETGLALAIAYFAVCSIGQMTLGAGIAAGATSARQVLRVPVVYAVVLALPFMIWGVDPPDWLANTTRLLGGILIPLMLISLGVSLAKLRVGSLGRSSALSLARLVFGFAVGVGLAEAFGFEGTARGVLILQSSMPTAVFNYLFSLRYGREPEEVAGMVMISTVLSFATLPLLLWFVL